jgi:hypothetical protein
MNNLSKIKQQAVMLARENCQTEETVTAVYWFPHETEVRLVEVDTTVPVSPDGKIHPYRFRPSPTDDMPAPSDIALISPEEVRKAELPEGWGTWDQAEKL